MPDYIGLYYPHSTFPNDALVKQAALYWDKLGRISSQNRWFCGVNNKR